MDIKLTLYMIAVVSCVLLVIPLFVLNIWGWRGKKKKDRQSLVITTRLHRIRMYFVGEKSYKIVEERKDI